MPPHKIKIRAAAIKLTRLWPSDSYNQLTRPIPALFRSNMSARQSSPRVRMPALRALDAPLGERPQRAVITAEMIGAVCIGCPHCCRCNLPAATLAACAAPGSFPTPFTYFLPNRKCVGCDRENHKKVYDLAGISIPLAVSGEFQHKFDEILRANPSLSQSEAIGIVLILHAPPMPRPAPAAEPPATRRQRSTARIEQRD